MGGYTHRETIGATFHAPRCFPARMKEKKKRKKEEEPLSSAILWLSDAIFLYDIPFTKGVAALCCDLDSNAKKDLQEGNYLIKCVRFWSCCLFVASHPLPDTLSLSLLARLSIIIPLSLLFFKPSCSLSLFFFSALAQSGALIPPQSPFFSLSLWQNKTPLYFPRGRITPSCATERAKR